MIFYTLRGPVYHLEIHEDKMLLKKNRLWKILGNKEEHVWPLRDLSSFQVSCPKLIWGKLEWITEDGKKTNFRFTTNSIMVHKIEKYLQKMIIKNYQKKMKRVA